MTIITSNDLIKPLSKVILPEYGVQSPKLVTFVPASVRLRECRYRKKNCINNMDESDKSNHETHYESGFQSAIGSVNIRPCYVREKLKK